MFGIFIVFLSYFHVKFGHTRYGNSGVIYHQKMAGKECDIKSCITLLGFISHGQANFLFISLMAEKGLFFLGIRYKSQTPRVYYTRIVESLVYIAWGRKFILSISIRYSYFNKYLTQLCCMRIVCGNFHRFFIQRQKLN